MMNKLLNKLFTKQSLTIVLVLAILFTLAIPVFAVSDDSSENHLKVAVISDDHYLSPTMIKDTEDFQFTMESDRKLLAESDAIFDAMLDAVRCDKPDVLLIPGDLTSNGEFECHQAVAEKLISLQNEMPDLKIYITAGNHDIRNSDGKNFNTEDGVAVPATVTQPEGFEAVYSFVFRDESVIARFTPAEGTEAGRLSYAARPAEGYTVLSIDSCLYSADVTSDGTNHGEVGGIISADLEAWILQQIAEAKERGDVVIAMMHHGIVPHYSLEPTLMSEFLVSNYSHVASVLADAGVNFVFTGHQHANDIAAYTSKSGNTIYDIETGSAITYPAPMRFVDFCKADGQLTANINTLKNLNVGSFVNPCTGETQSIDDLTEYARSLGYDTDSISNVAERIIGNFVYKYVSSDSVTAKWLLNKLNKHLYSIIDQVFAIPVDDEHTLIDAANYIYQLQESGDDNGIYPDWVQLTIDNIANGRIVDQVLNIIKREAFLSHLDKIKFDSIVTGKIEAVIGSALVNVIDSFGNDSNYVEDNDTVISVALPIVYIPDAPDDPTETDAPSIPATPTTPSISIIANIWNNSISTIRGSLGALFGK